MAERCNHTSVGMFVWKDEKLLLIERAKFPFGFAVPAGHVDDGEDFEHAAIRELKEEVGLNTKNIELIDEGKKENPCKREDGSWHYWKIYRIDFNGEIEKSKVEVKRIGWYTKEQIKKLAEKTEKYLEKKISEDEWKNDPGLEPVMYEWFKELKII